MNNSQDNKDNFKNMINDFLADHAAEYEDDPLKIEEPELDEDGCWICTAEDSKASYVLSDDGYGNIVINYLGSK